MGNYTVYEHIFPNGKRYIGITSQVPEKRWRNGSGYKTDQPVVYNAIQKYGWDNVAHNILYTELKFEDAIRVEKELILKYKTNCHIANMGYNMTNGGEGSVGRKMNNLTKEKIANAHRGRTGSLCSNSKQVIFDGKEYDSVTAFAQIFNLKHQTVSTWLTGRRGMPLTYFEKGLRFKNNKYPIYPQKSPHKNDYEYDGLKFNSQKELANHIGVSEATLSRWINGKNVHPRFQKVFNKIHKKQS